MNLQDLKRNQEKRSEEWRNEQDYRCMEFSIGTLLSDMDDLIEYAESLENTKPFLTPIDVNTAQSELMEHLANFLAGEGVMDIHCGGVAISIMAGIQKYLDTGDAEKAKQYWTFERKVKRCPDCNQRVNRLDDHYSVEAFWQGYRCPKDK